MVLEVINKAQADRQEMVKRLQERVAWLEAVHELQSIRLSRLEREVPEDALNEKIVCPASGEQSPQY